MNNAIRLVVSNVAPVRGYKFLYRHGETNHCPGCGRSHWYIGRILAECAFCATALFLNAPSGDGQ